MQRTLRTIPNPVEPEPLAAPRLGRMVCALPIMLAALAQPELLVVLPVSRNARCPVATLRARWRPGAVVPVAEAWQLDPAGRPIFQADHPARIRGPHRKEWRQARLMPAAFYRLAWDIQAHERRPPPAAWMDDATALLAGVAWDSATLRGGRRVTGSAARGTLMRPKALAPRLLRRFPRLAFQDEYIRQFGVGPWLHRDCDVWRVRPVPPPTI